MKRIATELFRALTLGGCIFLVTLVLYFIKGWSLSADELQAEFWEHIIISVMIYLCNSAVYFELGRRYGKLLFTGKYIALGIFSSLLASLVGIFLSRFALQLWVYDRPLEEIMGSAQMGPYWGYYLISILVAVVFYAFNYYKYYKETQVKEQKIIAGSASARFDALKNQLDPHFLFNSLNVLTSLIEEDPDQAQKFTTSLSKVYRYVLEQKNKDLVTVEEELNFARTYIRLLKMRFEDSIIFDIPETLGSPESKIVPLSLQLLLENAVKHNVVDAHRPLHIRVFEQAGMLVVANNLQEKQVVKKNSGVGLQNIHQRYKIFTDREVMIEKSVSEFRVALPLLSQKPIPRANQERYIGEKRLLKAKERVKALKEFYGHLMAYCIIIPALWVLNFVTTDFIWAIFPTLGWGFGILMHGMEAFGYNPIWGKRWEERKIRELMERDDL